MRKIASKWPFLILIANIGFFFAYTSYFSFNFPMQDDVTLVEFIVAKEQKKTESTALLADLFRVDNDHSIVIPRLITWINQEIEGALNFRHIVQYINLLLFLFFLLIARRFGKLKLELYFLLPVSFLLFQPHFFEVIHWPIVGLQHIHILIFVAIVLVLLEEKKSLFWPLLCAFMAGFTFGNGVALFVLIGIYLFFEGRKKEIGWTILSLIIYLMTLIPIFNFSQQAKFGFSLLNTSFFAFGILGSTALEFTKNQDAFAVGFGAILMVSIGYFTFQKWVKKNPTIDRFYFYLVIFVVGAILVIAIPRSGDDWTFYHTSRYFVYGVIALICLYLLGLMHLPKSQKKYLFFPMLGISLGFSFLSYYNNSATMMDRKNTLRADYDNWTRHQTVICEVPQVFHNVKPILLKAYSNQWLQAEKQLIPSKQLANLNQIASPFKTTVKLEIQNHADSVKGKSDLWIKRYSFIVFNRLNVDNPIDKSWYIVLQHASSKKSFVSPVSFKKGAIRDFVFKPGTNYLSKTGASIVHTEFLEHGKYQLYLCGVQENKKNSYYQLREEIQIDSQTKLMNLSH